ncbi:MAG TPA: methylenetetrahydrofolate--tRNA-(uracil(54)-C(5))-methyltransferase (FADH(2)-oxidizing) TrmFO [Syntrophomonadaceae bacterium]|nr:methylenetetrahydrofolate--tRNA-(uracil(54)-C(5))-methyltransferase (FADH(2)-oxidizing) TrmFO [Syntrophomonadaceae bacterium]
MEHINVVGGGLAGCEAAFHIANQGIKVRLWEMRPHKETAVHTTSNLAELVCSNSLKSEIPSTAQGLLKAEMKILGSLLLEKAETARVPAGSALAVDRLIFSELITEAITSHPLIEVIREEVTELLDDEIYIIATGPLTSDAMADFIQNLTGEDNLSFYDAISPSVTRESLDDSKVFRASRYGKGTADYLNCPFNQDEYEEFYEKLILADIYEGHNIDQKKYFNACMPIEVMAQKGKDTLRFGPMRPVGLSDPRTEERPYAVVQLRQEDKAGNIFGLVGFQTRMLWGAQDNVLRLIPGLENAEFVRYGMMHRNTYINSPLVLKETLQMKKHPQWLFAGQITGVEGYMESAATGIIAGYNAVRLLKGQELLVLDTDTLIGSLLDFISTSTTSNFQPMNANFGILPQLPTKIRDKKVRYEAYLQRSMEKMNKFSELFLKQL